MFPVSFVRLNQTNLTERCCRHMSSALSSQASSLKELDVGNNLLQDSGVEVLCAGLQSPCCSLTSLRSEFYLFTKGPSNLWQISPPNLRPNVFALLVCLNLGIHTNIFSTSHLSFLHRSWLLTKLQFRGEIISTSYLLLRVAPSANICSRFLLAQFAATFIFHIQSDWMSFQFK